jgi:Arginyl tRNA synthetase N terminal domain
VFPEALADRIRSILVGAGWPAPEEIRVAHPLRPEHGDYSTPIALRIGAPAGLIARGLRATEGIESADVRMPGHVNVRFTPDDLADTTRQLAGRPVRVEPGPARELHAELARLLRGADALDVPEDPIDPQDLAAPEQRRLICLLAETADIARRKPELLGRHFGDIENSWHRVAAIQPILPKGDEIATSHHSSGRLLAAATLHTLAGVDALP